MRKYFGTDGVRGRANEAPMTADFALKLGQAIGRKIADSTPYPRQIVIGKDTRLSCYMFEFALASGICSQGVDAVLVGALPTPAIAFMTRSIRAAAGTVISASHNPYYDNGIKFFDASGYKLPDEVELELEQMIDTGVSSSMDRVGKATRIETAVGRYIEFAKSTFSTNLDLKGLKIVVDCANGATYKVAPLAIEELGADVIVINDKPNGTNINDNCGSTYPQTMARMVVGTGADIGISFDGDGDRLIVCDSEGNIVDGDFIMGVCAIDMKKRMKLANDTIVGTVMSNQGFINSLKKQGIDVKRAQVGDRYVLEMMKARKLNLGGEQSGHLIFSDYNTTGDGLISALQLLKVMVWQQKPLNELTKSIETYPQLLVNMEVAKKIPLEELTKTTKLIKDTEAELSGDGRVLVRYSGTENKLRVMLEGQDSNLIECEAHKIAECAKSEIDALLTSPVSHTRYERGGNS
ncbi:phosphoglucosamine mutase [Deferribacterales bacterium]|nr:phosphoglucosamine mutase [Deferribacterales bacterium]